MIDVKLEGVCKKYNSIYALMNFSLEIKKGEFITLFGPSGCGKSTVLNLISGFIKPTSGNIFIRDQIVNDLPPYKRDTSMVFQSFALFPHMNVWDNIAFGLRMKKMNSKYIKHKLEEIITQAQLKGLERRMPNELSGGQQQRVALARAIVTEPAVILFDEPINSLDIKLRSTMGLEIKNLQSNFGITTIYVTHDKDEALTLSDRVVVMNNGYIEQIGFPKDIYENPTSKVVANYLGKMNFFNIVGIEDTEDMIALRTSKGTIFRVSADLLSNNGENAILAFRPEHCFLTKKPTDEFNCIKVTIYKKLFMGSYVKYVTVLNTGEFIEIDLPNSPYIEDFKVNENAFINIYSNRIKIF